MKHKLTPYVDEIIEYECKQCNHKFIEYKHRAKDRCPKCNHFGFQCTIIEEKKKIPRCKDCKYPLIKVSHFLPDDDGYVAKTIAHPCLNGKWVREEE